MISWAAGSAVCLNFGHPRLCLGVLQVCRRVPAARPGTAGTSLIPQRFAFFYSPEKGVKNMYGVLFPHVLLGKGIAWGQATGQWFS